MSFPLAPLLIAIAILSGQSSDLVDLERAAAASPSDVQAQRRLAAAYEAAGRRLDAVTAWTTVTGLAPQAPGGWYALGLAYSALSQEAIRSFEDRSEEATWRRLLTADSLLATGHLTDAFAIYRSVEGQLPSMVTIHEAIAQIYERSGHAAWAALERKRVVLPADGCAQRKPLCEFRAGRYQSALDGALVGSDPESRYWQARAARELARAAYAHLDSLPDSPERRASRAAIARAEDRHQDAVTELTAALTLAPGNPTLTFELATACYAARNYEQALATVTPVLRARPDDPRLVKLAGYSLLQLRRPEEALPLLQRAATLDPSDPGPQLALGRAQAQRGDHAAAIPLIEPHLGTDSDGSLHVQLARAYMGIGQQEKAAALLKKSEELHRAAEERSAAAARRKIEAPR
ncbi:MAG TPA: tetratricopeptide repeat protein [Vicinamibacterales bacterium]|nr:tetratricopeptide repeat protein [Vicinamibacterales bacterium]